MSVGNFGAIVVEPGHVRFRLWAPDARQVELVLASEAPKSMVRDSLGVFEVTLDCDVGTSYKYRIDGEFTVPDPASRLQSGDVHDKSIVHDPDFVWKNEAWNGRPWHETIIYELHVGAMGGYKGVAAQLWRLKSLGITAVEFMPIADFPGLRNWGYDGVLPYAPDTSYGTPNDLKALIDEAHGLELQVFLDVVYNHFGPDGNYLSSYASSFFDNKIHTPWGNAIDFRSPAVRRFFIENALYWLRDYRFDGLRFDAVHAIKDDSFLLEMAAEIRDEFGGRHIHLILENENNEAKLLDYHRIKKKFDAQWTDDWHHCLHVLLTGEDEGYYADFRNPVFHLSKCLGEGFAYQGQPSEHAGRARGSSSGHLPLTSFVICLQNHDQIGNRAMGDRLSTLADPDALRAATVLLLMTPQIPLIFMGEEWAETKPFLFFTDHHNELADLVREGRRQEFAHFQSFVDPKQREKIPDPNAASTFNCSCISFPEKPTPQQATQIDFIRQALSVRTEHITPHLTDVKTVQSIVLGEWGIRASWRLADGRILTVAANFGAEELVLDPEEGCLIFSSKKGWSRNDRLPPRSAFSWISR